MTKWLKIILIIGVLIFGYFYYAYYVERKTIEYVNTSSIFEYNSEYQIIYGQGNFDSKMFAEWVKKRDLKLGQIIEMSKFYYLNNEEYNGFYWTTEPNQEISNFSEYSFFDFLKQNKSVEFRPNEIRNNYKKGFYYKVVGDSLSVGEKMNLDGLLKKYKSHLKCEKVFSSALNTKTISLFFNIENSDVRIISSNFSKESETFIKEMVTDQATKINSSFFLLFDFPDLEDFECN
jgi:hypothetical protein